MRLRSAIRFLQTAIVMLLFSITATSQAAPPELVVRPRPQPQNPRAFERVEWLVEAAAKYSNPFDPEEIAIDATFRGPGGRTILLPAFWSETAGEQGGQWVVRFCPTVAGRWSIQVAAKDRSGVRTSAVLEFDVADSSGAGGFIRRAAGNSRYFQFDSGKAFFPIGLNVAWPGSEGLSAYEQFFGKLSASGGNFARVWVCHPNRMTETKDLGIGRLDLAACEYYDQVLGIAERNGIYCMLTFGNYRDLRVRDNWGECIWPQFPYNAANGGPCTRPVDFFTDTSARTVYRNRLRYIVARYSAFTNVAFWEFWNEQDLTNIDVPVEWIREMAAYLKMVDPYQHLVTTSVANTHNPAVWRVSEIDLTQVHYYGDAEHVTDFTSTIAAAAREHDAYSKPFALAELGISPYASDEKYDPGAHGTLLHDGMWAAMMSGAAGSSWHWWWDNYVTPKDLWGQYKGISKFAAQVEWNKLQLTPLALPPPQRTNADPNELDDLKVTCSGGWGKVASEPVVVPPSGYVTSAIQRYFCGPGKPQLYKPLKLVVDLPAPTTMTARVVQVSDYAVMRVSIDDQPAADWSFSALPGMADQESTKRREEPDGVYQAMIHKDRQVTVPAGKHTITLDLVAGDWMMLGHITFAKAKSARFADLIAVGLADQQSGQRLVWLHDARSNWKNDLDGVKPRVLDDVALTIPTSATELKLEWWNTRSGEVVSTQAVAAKDGAATVIAPPFSRDIAVRAVPAN